MCFCFFLILLRWFTTFIVFQMLNILLVSLVYFIPYYNTFYYSLCLPTSMWAWWRQRLHLIIDDWLSGGRSLWSLNYVPPLIPPLQSTTSEERREKWSWIEVCNLSSHWGPITSKVSFSYIPVFKQGIQICASAKQQIMDLQGHSWLA